MCEPRVGGNGGGREDLKVTYKLEFEG
jgi:hypothetical protein